MNKEKKKTVMVSGGFDPVHVGHIRMIRDAAQRRHCGGKLR